MRQWFTRQQQTALVALTAILLASVLVHQLRRWLDPPPAYDFSAFEEAFNSRRDSIFSALRDTVPDSANDRSPSQPPGSGRININTADEDELATLPRIGPRIARRIIEYRKRYGPFSGTDEITAVRGIGEKTFEGLKEQITVEQ